MGNIITTDSGRHLTKNQIIDVLRITNLLPELASKVLDKIIQGEYTTVSRMEDILDELKLPTPKKHEILEEMRLTYKAIKEQEKRNRMKDQASSAMSLSSISRSSVGGTEDSDLEKRMKRLEVDNKELKADNKTQKIINKDKDQEIKELKADNTKLEDKLTKKITSVAKITEGFTPKQNEAMFFNIKMATDPLYDEIKSLKESLTKVTKERDDLLVEKLDLIKKHNLKADDGLLSNKIAREAVDEMILKLTEEKKQIKEARDDKLTEKSSARAEYINKKAELAQQIYDLKNTRNNFKRIDELNSQIAQCDSKITELNTRIANIDAKGQELLSEKDKEIKEYKEKKSKIERMEFDYITIPDNLILISSSKDNPITTGVN